jgi:hypothetical protein
VLIVRNMYYILFPHTIFSPHSRTSIWKKKLQNFLEVFQEVRCMDASPWLSQSRFATNKDKYEEMPTYAISHLVMGCATNALQNHKTKYWKILDFCLALFPSIKSSDTQRPQHENSRKTRLFVLKAKAKPVHYLGPSLGLARFSTQLLAGRPSKLNEDFQWLCSVLEQTLESYKDSRLHWRLLGSSTNVTTIVMMQPKR